MKTICSMLTILFLFTTTSCFADGFEIQSIETSEAKREHGNIWVNLAVKVKNTGSASKGWVAVEAVDKGGYTMKQKKIVGTIPPGSTGTLTDSMPITEYEYDRIKKWKVAN